MAALTLAEAQIILNTAVAKATEWGKRMSVSIVDSGGHVVLSARMDKVAWISVQMAETMAESAIAFGMNGAQLARFNNELWVSAAMLPNGRRVIGLEGAVRIKRDGEVVGAVACAGGTSEEDRVACEEGIKAAGLAF